MKFLRFISVICMLLMCVGVSFAAEKEETTPPKAWMDFLGNLKKEMLAKGISQKTLDKAYGENTYYHPKPAVVAQDKKQAEFVLTSREYINKLVSETRVEKARKEYKRLQKKYKKIEDEYQVPLNYLVSFWAVETNFGQNKGKYHK